MKTKDILGCVGWATFFIFASFWIPFVGPFFSLLTPLPFLYYSIRLGFPAGVKLAIMTVLVVSFISTQIGQPQIIFVSVELSLLGLALSELFYRKLSLGHTIFFATVIMLLLGLGCLFFISLSKNMGPLEMMRDYLEGHLQVAIKVYEEMGMAQENANELKTYITTFTEYIFRIFPSLMIVGSGFTVWLNIIIAKPLFRSKNLKYPDFVQSDRWRTPEGLIWGVIISGFALFVSSGSIESLAINALIVMSVIYLFHGLSILLFFLNKYRFPSWIRMGVYFLIIIQQLFFVVLALAGLFDQWVDFRKIYNRKKAE